jgi:hypothetical protein
MQIQDDGTHVLNENPDALLDGAEKDAAALHRCLKIVRLWNQSSSLPRSRRDEMIEEKQRLANLYAATLFEIGCAFGIGKTDELKVRIEAACILGPWHTGQRNRADADSWRPCERLFGHVSVATARCGRDWDWSLTVAATKAATTNQKAGLKFHT